MSLRMALLLAVASVLGGGAALAQSTAENNFASIYLNDDKIGQVHFVVRNGASGEVDRVTVHASVSVFGIQVADYLQTLHEDWRGAQIQRLSARSSNGDDTTLVEVTRAAAGLQGSVNGQPVSLPATAFPASPWHFAITQQNVLFAPTDLQLMNVQVASTPDQVMIAGQTVAATRYDFTGDWTASVWFDAQTRLVQAQFDVNGHTVQIRADAD